MIIELTIPKDSENEAQRLALELQQALASRYDQPINVRIIRENK